MAVGISAGKTVLAFEDVRRSGEACFRQQCGMDALARGMCGVNAFDGGAGMIKLRQPAAERRNQAEGFGDALAALVAREQQAGGGGRLTEAAAGGGALEAAPEMRGLQ